MTLTLSQIVVIIGFVLVLAELFVGIEAGFDLVLLGSILVIAGLLGELSNSIAVTLIVSAALASLYIGFGRQVIKKKIVVLTHKTNIDKLIGKTGIVVRSITPDTAGLIRLDDEDWRATASEVLHEKATIEVVGIEGVTLKVRKK